MSAGIAARPELSCDTMRVLMELQACIQNVGIINERIKGKHAHLQMVNGPKQIGNHFTASLMKFPL
jgi:hypothetical protein